MRPHLLVVGVVALASLACGHEPPSPVSPTSTREPAADSASWVRGEVRDTTNLPISGARVQVVAPGAAPDVVTDEDGQFMLPWPFSGIVTVRVSKEGFHPYERPVPEPGSPRRPAFLRFDLEATDGPIVVAGMYQMTLTAAGECTQLPNVARQRTYRAQVYATSRVRWFATALFDGDFPYGSVVSAEVLGEPLHTLRLHLVTEPDWGNPVTTVVERIGGDMILEFTGSADIPIGARSASAAFDGTLTVCPAEAAAASGSSYRCPVRVVTCQSARHRLNWFRH